jgi:hypothetical protein
LGRGWRPVGQIPRSRSGGLALRKFLTPLLICGLADPQFSRCCRHSRPTARTRVQCGNGRARVNPPRWRDHPERTGLCSTLPCGVPIEAQICQLLAHVELVPNMNCLWSAACGQTDSLALPHCRTGTDTHAGGSQPVALACRRRRPGVADKGSSRHSRPPGAPPGLTASTTNHQKNVGKTTRCHDTRGGA